MSLKTIYKWVPCNECGYNIRFDPGDRELMQHMTDISYNVNVVRNRLIKEGLIDF